MADERTINQEAGLPDNWVPKDTKPIVPGAAPPSFNGVRSELGDFYSGSLAPALQHDANFVRTGYQVPSGGAQTPLMPLAPSGLPGINSAVQSVIDSIPKPPIVINGTMRFRGVWKAYVPYAVNDVVLFNVSAYVAISASTNEEPDNNTVFWTLLSENLVFDADVFVPGSSGFGTFSNVQHNEADSSPTPTSPIGGPITPGVNSGFAVLLTSISDGANVIPGGWVDLGTPMGFVAEGVYVHPFTTNAVISTTQTNVDVRWVTNILIFGGQGEALVSPVTSVTVSGDIATVQVANSWIVGTRVKFTGIANAVFLNNQTVVITSRTGTSITFAFVNADYGPAADSGTATNIPFLQSKGLSPTSSGAPQNVPFTFDNPLTAGSTILIAALIEDTNGIVSINGVSDTQSNSYTLVPGSNDGGLKGSAAWGAFTQNVPAGSPVVNCSITTNTGALGLTMIAVELPGTSSGDLYNYLPYDVFQFRGSMFVCNTATHLDAFADPNSWWLLAQGTGYVDSLSSDYTPTILDYGRLISNATALDYTVTLPTLGPSNSWWAAFQNSGTGTLTIDPNGTTLDGSSSPIVLLQGEGILVFTNGTLYLSIKGIGISTGVTSLNGETGDLTITGSGGAVITTPTATTINIDTSGVAPFNQSMKVDSVVMSDDYWISVDEGAYDQALPLVVT